MHAFVGQQGHLSSSSSIGQFVVSPTKRLSLGAIIVRHVPRMLVDPSAPSSNSTNGRHENLTNTFDSLVVGDDEHRLLTAWGPIAQSAGVLKIGGTGDTCDIEITIGVTSCHIEH